MDRPQPNDSTVNVVPIQIGAPDSVVQDLRNRLQLSEESWALLITEKGKLERELVEEKSARGLEVAQMRGLMTFWRDEDERSSSVAEDALRAVLALKIANERLLERLIDIGREAGEECKHCNIAQRWGTEDYEPSGCGDEDCFGGWYIPFIPQVKA